MKFDWRNNKDFFGGLLLISIGVIGFYMAFDYPFGSAQRMGPGYFPRVLNAILIAFGVYVMLRGMKTGEKVSGVWGWKPLAYITASLVVFGWIMDRAGMVPALVAMFFTCALGGHEFKFKEVAILTIIMTAFSIVVFVYGLGMPYRLFWW